MVGFESVLLKVFGKTIQNFWLGDFGLLVPPIFFAFLDDSAEEKKFEATERKRRRVRESGQVARSMELNNLAILGVGFASLFLSLQYVYKGFKSYVESIWGEFDFDIVSLAEKTAAYSFGVIVPFLVLMFVVALAVNFAQVGIYFSVQPLTPDFNRLNPVSGLRKIFNKRTIVNLLKTLIKFVIFALVLYKDVVSMLALMFSQPYDASILIGIAVENVIKITAKFLVIILIIALLDFFYERWQFNEDIKMTLQEYKQEIKDTEGKPEVKQEIRNRIRQILSQSSKERVAQADMVVTNPTHFAVALQIVEDVYVPGEGKKTTMLVVYKGADEAAARIRGWAEEFGVVMVRSPAVARYLFFNVPVGEFVPSRMLRVLFTLYYKAMEAKKGKQRAG